LRQVSASVSSRSSLLRARSPQCGLRLSVHKEHQRELLRLSQRQRRQRNLQPP
jgi:hypothetical protein